MVQNASVRSSIATKMTKENLKDQIPASPKYVTLRCGNPYCGASLEGNSKRLCDVSYMCGVIKCPRCRSYNNVVVWDSKVIRLETYTENGKVLYLFETNEDTIEKTQK